MEELLNTVENQPDNLQAKSQLVQKYLDNHDYENAKKILQEIINVQPSNLDANYILSQLYEFDEEFKAAAECFQIVAEQRPSYNTKYKLAQLYESADEYDKALALFNICYDENPKDDNIIERVAHTSRILGDYDTAIEFYNKLLKIDQNNIVALTQLAELYEGKDNLLMYIIRARINELEGMLSHAVSAYKKALAEAENPDDILQIRFSLADIYIKKENHLQAIDEYLSILEHDPNNYKVYKNLADTYIHLKNEVAACEAYERAIEIYPEDEAILKELADIYIDLERNEDALKLLEKIITLEPNNLSHHTNLAKVYIAMNMDDKAQEKLDFVLQKDANNVEATGVLVDFYLLKNEYENTLKYVEQIKKLIPNSPFGYRKAGEVYETINKPFESHYNFGIYHDLKGEKQLAIDEFTWASREQDNLDVNLRLAKLYEEISEEYIAVEYYQKAHNIDKANINVLQKMADIYMKKKDYEQVIDIFNEIISISDKNPEIYMNLGIAYENSRNNAKALENYKIFVEKTPLSTKVDEIKQRITKLESKVYGEEDEGLINKIFRLFSR